MATRKRNGQFARKSTTRRRRSPKRVNVANLAQNYLVLDAMTKGFFSVSLSDFVGLTKNLDHGNWSSKYDGVNNSWELTLPELASIMFGQKAGISSGHTPMEMVKANLQRNGGRMVASVFLIPMAFKLGRKVLGKPLITPANRLLKSAGVRI